MESPEQPISFPSRLFAWLPQLNRDIWILALGQLLLFIGQGFTLVYASIYFVNQLGFSTTQVGVALSSAGVSGIVGRFWAGNAVDSPPLRRKGTLLLASVVAAIACFCLAFATTFSLLVMGNVLLGLGLSLYWPATLAVTTDLTTPDNRTEAFALTRLTDNLGLGLGALLAGQYVALSGNYRVLFVSKGVAYLVFASVIYLAIAETYPHHLGSPAHATHSAHEDSHSTVRAVAVRWWKALSDRLLVIYLIANLFFTTYTAQVSSTLPLFLANFVFAGHTPTGFSEQWISYLFVWHALLKIVLQLPVARWVKPFNPVTALLGALVLWAIAFLLIWVTGIVPSYGLIVAVGAFSFIALAEILYAPSATALVGDMAPDNQRGIYFSLESECWAIGFLIGPALGGWALDHPTLLGTQIWLVFLATTLVAATVLLRLRQGIGAIARYSDVQMD